MGYTPPSSCQFRNQSFRVCSRESIGAVPRRIETHVKICVLSLLIERVAEIACQQPWSQIRRKMKMLQVSDFFLKHRFYMRNKLLPEVSQTLKTLVVVAPKSILEVKNIS